MRAEDIESLHDLAVWKHHSSATEEYLEVRIDGGNINGGAPVVVQTGPEWRFD